MKKSLTLLMALVMGLSAMAQIKRIAILETIDKEDKVPYAVEVMVRSNLTKVISSTPGYEGYDRVNISQIMDEHEFERTGMVNEEQIRQLGEISGADFILVSEAVKFEGSNDIFVTAKILNVVTAKTESEENKLMGMTPHDIQHGCESLANILLGNPDPHLFERKFNEKEAEGNGKPEPDKAPVALAPVAKAVSKVGDLKMFPDGSRGLVFYVDGEGRGLAVSLVEGNEYWDKSRRLSDIGMLDNMERGDTLMRYGEGMHCTQILINALGSDAQAASWCRSLGPDWYLPSLGELYKMIKVFRRDIMLAAKLKSSGGGEIDDWLWSSTENDKDEAWNVSSGGRMSLEDKKTKVKVRAIRAFMD